MDGKDNQSINKQNQYSQLDKQHKKLNCTRRYQHKVGMPEACGCMWAGM